MNTFLIVSNLLLWVCMLVQLFVVYQLARMMGEFLGRFRAGGSMVERVQLNEYDHAPAFRAVDQHGQVIKLNDAQNQYTLLLFKSQTCGTCHEVSSQLPTLQTEHPHLRILVMEQPGPVHDEIPAGISRLQSSEIFTLYAISKVPQMFLIDPQGTIVQTESVRSFAHLSNQIREYFRQAS